MKRPLLVTVIGLLAIVSGIAQTVFGLLFIGLRHDATFLAESNLTTGKITYFGIAAAATGVLTILFAIGLLKGSRLCRNLIVLMELIGIGTAIYAIIELDSTRRASAISTIVAAVVVLYFLFGTKKAQAFFADS
jgi:uncharacterized membrane protein (DUF2068 family)